MIFALVLDNEVITSEYKRPIKNRIKKEIKKGNRKFEEVTFSDVEFQCVFCGEIEKVEEYLKFKKRIK